MEARTWEKHSQDFAFREIYQEFEPQRFQLHQASRWADEAQRHEISSYGELELRNGLFQEVPFLRFQDVWMSIVKADRDVNCHVARTCLRSFWQLTKETDGIGSIHDVLSRVSLSSNFPTDVERLPLHPRLFPMWLRDSFGAAVCLFSFPCHCRTATLCHRDAPCPTTKGFQTWYFRDSKKRNET